MPYLMRKNSKKTALSSEGCCTTHRERDEHSVYAIVTLAREVLSIEAEGIVSVRDRLDEHFERLVHCVAGCRGRVITTGIGKSGIVARKIAATLSSTGTPSLFLHASEALHGDLGIVRPHDVLLALSNSGETEELCQLVQVLKPLGIPVLSFVGSLRSRLASLSDVAVDVSVPREACPLGLVPTSSTTAMLAVGDALAVVLIRMKNFSSLDFQRFHPGGHLGERLRVPIGEIMRRGEAVPMVTLEDDMDRVVAEMNEKGLGATLVMGGRTQMAALCGIITDGDLRRAIVRWGGKLSERKAHEIMTPQPKTIAADRFVSDALSVMEQHLITVLPVVDGEAVVRGIIHLHDLLGKGKIKFTL